MSGDYELTLKMYRTCEACSAGYYVGLSGPLADTDQRIIGCPACRDDGAIVVSDDDDVTTDDVRELR